MKNGKLNKAVKIFTIITTVITLFSAVFTFVLPMFLSYKLQIYANEASSIAIIGGADGPTAIYVTSKSSPYMITVIFGVLSIAGIIYQYIIKRQSS